MSVHLVFAHFVTLNLSVLNMLNKEYLVDNYLYSQKCIKFNCSFSKFKLTTLTVVLGSDAPMSIRWGKTVLATILIPVQSFLSYYCQYSTDYSITTI